MVPAEALRRRAQALTQVWCTTTATALQQQLEQDAQTYLAAGLCTPDDLAAILKETK